MVLGVMDSGGFVDQHCLNIFVIIPEVFDMKTLVKGYKPRLFNNKKNNKQ